MYPPVVSTNVSIPVFGVQLPGELTLPHQAFVVIIFVHGSGSSRHSNRNKKLAQYFNSHGMATLLFDLLTSEEDHDYTMHFNIQFLSQRLQAVANWLSERDGFREMRMGLIGSGTGAASALIASIHLPRVAAIVSRAGRLDLVMNILPEVKAATLLLAGSMDHEGTRLNRVACDMLNSEKSMEIIDGSSHLFEEGAMEKICILASEWFERHLMPPERAKANQWKLSENDNSLRTV